MTEADDAHDPYECGEPGCPICKAHWLDVEADRQYDERKERDNAGI